MKLLTLCLVLLGLTTFPTVRAAVSRDANGWTNITPSADTRFVHVSTSGSDANDGSTPELAMQTLLAAKARIREGFPDHLLLKRGEEFPLPAGGFAQYRSGRSGTEPTLISSYGTSGARPVVKIQDMFIDHAGATKNHLFIKGIEIYRQTSDPAFAGYVECTHSLRFVGAGANIKIEDCVLRFMEVTVQTFPDDNPTRYTNFEFRRNIVVDAWKHNSTTTKLGKISGMFVSGVTGYLIEENFFDHNGWNESVSGAGANQYNHNIYVQYNNSEGGIMRGNISARGSAHGLQARSGGRVERNLFVLNAVGFNIGGEGVPTDPDVAGYNNIAYDNVVLNGRRMSLTSSSEPQTPAVWGIWEATGFIADAHVDMNIVANRLESGENTAFNGISNMDFGVNISYNWYPAQDTFNASWPHPNDDLGDYYTTIGGTNSTTAYLSFLRARPPGVYSWKYTSYSAISYIRAGFSWTAVPGEYLYPEPPSPLTVTIAATDASAGEAANPGQFTVTCTPAPSTPLTVNLIRSGSATNGSDYASIATTVTVPVSGSATIPVTVIDDQLLENAETVVLTVTTGSGYSVGAANAATVTIADNDTGVIASAGGGFVNTALAPGQTGTFTATFYATPSNSGSDAIVGLANAAPAAYPDVAAVARFNISGNIDARNGAAYAAAATIPYIGGLTYAFRLVVNISAHTYSIYVTPPGGSELTVGTNYAFRTEQAAVTSLNYRTAQIATPAGASLMVTNFALSTPPPPTVTIAATDASAGEPANHGLFTVTASPAPASPISVNLSRTGTANNGSDYASIATTISIGTSGTATIPVTVLDDQILDGSETVTLTITTGTGYAIGAANSATVTIADDDTGVIATAGGGFVNTALAPGQTGTFTATFYATPSHSGSDAIVGLANAAPAGYPDVAAVARFNISGNIDARNGAAYAAAATIPYTGGLTYAFRLLVNISAHTYSIYVTPPGGSELTVGSNYAFRTEQAAVTSLNYRTAQIATPTGASLMVTNFALTTPPPTNLLSHGTFEPDQATVLQDMVSTFILGTHPANIWQGRVGSVTSQNTTYQTSGSNHYIAVGASANGPGAFQVVTWPGTGTRTLTFQYRGTGSTTAKIFGGNTGAAIEKFSGSNTLTLLQTITKSTASSWTNATHTITLNGSYNYLVIQLKGGDFDTLAIAP